MYVWNDLLGRLVGCRLYSVQFVLDYVQLRFDGPTRDEPVLNCASCRSLLRRDAGSHRDKSAMPTH